VIGSDQVQAKVNAGGQSGRGDDGSVFDEQGVRSNTDPDLASTADFIELSVLF